LEPIPRADRWYLLFLAGLILAYACYFFTFTLFDGLSTLSSDSASYMILARKWSPWATPDFVSAQTWPVISFPPGFPWALTITGASTTLWTAHLFVSACMLLTLAGAGWFACRKFGWLTGGLLTLSLCLAPGVVISSLGILSENSYLLVSLSTLWLFVSINKSEKLAIFPYAALLVLLALALLTRTVGIALLPALVVPALLGKGWRPQHRIASIFVVAATLILWAAWKAVNPQSDETSYGSYLGIFTENLGPGLGNVLTGLWSQVRNNVIEIVIAFKNYFSLGHPGSYYFLIFAGIFLICIASATRRLFQLRPDAWYVFCYLGILAIWPYPAEMMRFLHPLVILLVMQPFLVLYEANPVSGDRLAGSVSLVLCLLMVVSVLPIHRQMIDTRTRSVESETGLEHSIDYLGNPYDPQSERFAMAMKGVMESMAESAKFVPREDVVAAVKHEFYALLAGRAAVNLTARVSIPQQLCNLEVAGVDWIFISELTTAYNPMGSKIVERFAGITTEEWTYVAIPDLVETSLLKIDPQKLQARLVSARTDCDGFRQHSRMKP
jgi:hypothetical protein